MKRGYHILCKSTAALPYMNRPIKRKTWRHRLWSWLDPPHKRVDRDIHSYPAPARIDGGRVTFSDGTTYDADVLVYATGYCQRFPFLDAGGGGGGVAPEGAPGSVSFSYRRFASVGGSSGKSRPPAVRGVEYASDLRVVLDGG